MANILESSAAFALMKLSPKFCVGGAKPTPNDDREVSHSDASTLKSLRDALGLSQRQLARLVGVHPSFIGNIEVGIVGLPERHRRFLEHLTGTTTNMPPTRSEENKP